MERISVTELEPFEHPAGATEGGRALADALGTTDVALNHYTLEPGDACSGGMHTHLDQEEIFYVLAGTVTFQTDDASREVGEGELIRFGTGEYHHGVNQSEEKAVVLAIGAPGARHDWKQIRVPMPCPECPDVDAMGVDFSAGGELRCPDCGETMRV